MKKTALVLGMSALTLIYGKYDPSIRPRVHKDYQPVSEQNSKIISQKENSLVQLQNAGMKEIQFRHLQKTLGKIDISTYTIKDKTPIILIESLNHNISVKGFNKMIDNFNSLYSTDNEALMRNYQDYADRHCQKIYGCVGTEANAPCDWKIIKFLPNPEKCNFEPTITMSNVML
jgi:hypothetical protein